MFLIVFGAPNVNQAIGCLRWGEREQGENSYEQIFLFIVLSLSSRE